MAERLPIIDVAATGIGRAIRSLPGLLAIYWLPWLLGTVALLILEVIIQDQLRLGRAPDWARNMVWAPFGAMTYLMLLRWMVNGQAPARAINLDTGREAWIATPMVAMWFIADLMVSHAPFPLTTQLALAWDIPAAEVMPYLHALQLAAWLTDGALTACFLGLIVVVVRRGWPDPRELWRLLRLQPARLLCIGLLATAAAGGLLNLGSWALAWLGADRLAPFTMTPWRENIHAAFVAELPYFPLQFLEFAIEGAIVAEAYRRLLSPGMGDSPKARA